MIQFVKKVQNKIKRSIYIFYIRNLRKYFRFSSYPYVSGDTFRSMSNHVIDEISDIKLSKVNNQDIIFVKTDYLNYFFEEVFPKLTDEIKLITHNSDYEIDNKYISLIKNSNITWFAQNLTIDTKEFNMFKPIPIGLENRSYLKNGKLSHFKEKNLFKGEKLTKIYCSFNFSTNNERIYIYNLIKDHNEIVFSRFKDHKRFIHDLSKYQFNLCPEGNGIDTHRLWESLMLGVVPIVKKNNFIKNLSDHKIPMLVLDEWTDLLKLTKQDLNEIYSSKKNEIENNDYLFIDYWEKYINN